jgi:hypothetical protein
MFVKIEEREIPFSREQHEGLDEPSQLLLKAAALIEEYGHATNGDLRNLKGMCTWGALAWAHHGDQWPSGHQGPEAKAMKRIAASIGLPGGGNMVVCDWNNRHTKEEVVAKLRAVALGG